MGRLVIKKGQIEIAKLFKWYETPIGEPNAMTLDFPIQRPELLWNNEKRGRFIHALFVNDPIPPIYITHDKDDNMITKMILDGKQRLTTLYSYIHNGFSLWKYTPDLEWVVYERDEDGNHIYDEFGNKTYHTETVQLGGKRFSKLPKFLQETLLGTLLDCIFISDYTNEDLSRIMYNLNNGQATTPTQKSIMKLGMELGTHIRRLSENDLFQNRVSFTKGECKRSEGYKCVLFSLMQWTGQQNDEVSYNKLSNASDLSKFSETFKGIWSERDLDAMDDIFTTLDNVLPEDNTLCEVYLRASHLPVLVMNVDKYLTMLDDGVITEEQYKEFLVDWFTTGIHSEAYTQYEGKSINDKANVEARIDVMGAALDRYVGVESRNDDMIADNTSTDSEKSIDGDTTLKDFVNEFGDDESVALASLAEIDARTAHKGDFTSQTIADYKTFFLVNPDKTLVDRVLTAQNDILNVNMSEDNQITGRYNMPILIHLYDERVNNDADKDNFLGWLRAFDDCTEVVDAEIQGMTFDSLCRNEDQTSNGTIRTKYAILDRSLDAYVEDKNFKKTEEEIENEFVEKKVAEWRTDKIAENSGATGQSA